MRPPCVNILVEGLPGVGKLWVTKTLNNVTSVLAGTEGATVTTAPSGTAAALVGGVYVLFRVLHSGR